MTFSTLQRDRRRAPNGDDANLEDHEEIDLTRNRSNNRRSFQSHGNQPGIRERPKSAIPELPGSTSWKKYSMHVNVDAWAPGVRVPDCTQPDILFSRVVSSKPALKLTPPEEQREASGVAPQESTEGGQGRAAQRRPWSAFARMASAKSTGQPRSQARELGLTRGEILQRKETIGAPGKAARRPASAKPRLQRHASCPSADANVAVRPRSAGKVGPAQYQPHTLHLQPGRSHRQLTFPQTSGREHVSTARTRRPSCGARCGPWSVARNHRWR